MHVCKQEQLKVINRTISRGSALFFLATVFFYFSFLLEYSLIEEDEMSLLAVAGGCFVRQMYINNPRCIREQSLALGYIGNTRERDNLFTCSSKKKHPSFLFLMMTKCSYMYLCAMRTKYYTEIDSHVLSKRGLYVGEGSCTQ